jgi:predicted nucleic acid-binding protein
LNVYVESNFVLQLALLQEFHASCEAILQLCEGGGARLVIPAFSLVEPYRTLGLRHSQRERLKRDLDTEFRQLARTSSFGERLAEFQNLTSLLIDSADEESRLWEGVRARLLTAADVVPIDAEILDAAARHRLAHALEPYDAIVYASVLSHLERSGGTPGCFLNADAKDFDDPDLVAELARRQCKLIFRFDDGLRYLSRPHS